MVLSKAVSWLLLDRKGRQSLKKRRRSASARKADARAEALAQVRAQSDQVMTDARKELIRQALSVRNARQKILDDLNDEDRARLVALAVRNLMNEDPDNPGAPAPSAPPDAAPKGAAPAAAASPSPKAAAKRTKAERDPDNGHKPKGPRPHAPVPRKSRKPRA